MSEKIEWTFLADTKRDQAEIDRLHAELAKWQQRAFDITFEAAKDNPNIRAQIERERKAECPDMRVLSFTLD